MSQPKLHLTLHLVERVTMKPGCIAECGRNDLVSAGLMQAGLQCYIPIEHLGSRSSAQAFNPRKVRMAFEKAAETQHCEISSKNTRDRDANNTSSAHARRLGMIVLYHGDSAK